MYAPSRVQSATFKEVLNSQELLGDELEMFARKETQKDVVVPKKSGEPLGIVVVSSFILAFFELNGKRNWLRWCTRWETHHS